MKTVLRYVLAGLLLAGGLSIAVLGLLFGESGIVKAVAVVLGLKLALIGALVAWKPTFLRDVVWLS